MAVTSTAIAGVVGQKPFKRKFKLTTGGTFMATRGKKMSRGKTMSKGKKKKKKK
mgnify:CR=1 FL=1